MFRRLLLRIGEPPVIYDSLPNALKSFDYITKIGKFSWFEKRMIKYSGAFIMTLVAKKIKKRESIENPEAFLRQMTAEWAEGLKGDFFMGGRVPNGADLAVFGITQVVSDLKAGKIFRENKAYDAWMDHMEEALQNKMEMAKN
jgi:microsomal prostaglandin-E synthase 2